MSPAQTALHRSDVPQQPTSVVPSVDSTREEPPRTTPETEPELPDGFEDAALDVQAEFRRRLAGGKGLSREQRSGVVRAAYEWRQIALKALAERRAESRKGAKRSVRMQRPPPMSPGAALH